MRYKNFFKNKSGKISINKIIMALVLSIFVGVFGFFSYGFYKTDDALSTVPRADLMPDQTPKNTPSTEQSSPTSSTSTSTTTPTTNGGKTPDVHKVDKDKLNKSVKSKNNDKGDITVSPPHSIDYEKLKSVNGLVSGAKLKSLVKNNGEIDANKIYSVDPNRVNGVSTVVNDSKVSQTPGGVETYLFMGSDSRNVAKDRGRSDSLMLAYVNRSHNKVYLISFPRDLYVKIPGYARQKINAAYNKGGAPLTVQTIQNFTGVKINHAAIVNFNSFVNLVDSVGGVKVYNPYTGCDRMQHLCWKKGELNLKSWDALHYVRWRHGLPNGDVDRARNQQTVVKAILAKAASPNMLANPNKLSDFIKKAGQNVVVDSSLTNSKIIGEVLGMRITSSNDIRTLTAPITGYYMDPIYGSVDLVNAPRMQELRRALASDNLDAYWNKYKNAPVAGAATEYKTNNW